MDRKERSIHMHSAEGNWVPTPPLFTLDTSGFVFAWPLQSDGEESHLCVWWSDLDPFTQGYVEAKFAGVPFFLMECPACEWDCIIGPPAIGDLGICCPLCAGDSGRDVKLRTEARLDRDWSGTVEGSDDRKKGFSDLAPETLAAILKDCEWFLSAQEPSRRDFEQSVQAGANFYRLRQAGGFQNPPLPPLAVSLGDDGKVYLT